MRRLNIVHATLPLIPSPIVNIIVTFFNHVLFNNWNVCISMQVWINDVIIILYIFSDDVQGISNAFKTLSFGVCIAAEHHNIATLITSV